MTRDEAKRVLATVLRYTACDADYAYDKEDGGVELVPGQDIVDAICMAIAALNEQEERRWIPVEGEGRCSLLLNALPDALTP